MCEVEMWKDIFGNMKKEEFKNEYKTWYRYFRTSR